MFISPVIWRQDFVNLTLVHSNWGITHPLTPGAKNALIVHSLKLIKIKTSKTTCIVSIDFHRLVKPLDINRLIFYRFYCLYLLDPMIYFHRLGLPELNQGNSSGSNNSLIRYQHHVWREQFRESRETFQESFERTDIQRFTLPIIPTNNSNTITNRRASSIFPHHNIALWPIRMWQD